MTYNSFSVQMVEAVNIVAQMVLLTQTVVQMEEKVNIVAQMVKTTQDVLYQPLQEQQPLQDQQLDQQPDQQFQ